MAPTKGSTSSLGLLCDGLWGMEALTNEQNTHHELYHLVDDPYEAEDLSQAQARSGQGDADQA